jgi:rare lipoprotein A
VLIGLAACAGPSSRDGPPDGAPPDPAAIADAQPRIEPIRAGGPNRPYEVLGRDYVPVTQDRPMRERGLASWYGRKFHGKRTASGEVYDMHAMTAAHKTMPLPSYARVRNPANGREVIVRVNDRGPFVAGRVIDLSYAAALKLEVHRGVAAVEVERLTFEQIRTGAWRRTRPEPAAPEETVVAAPAAIEPAPMVPERRAASGGFWVQLGAFRERDGAESFRAHLGAEFDWLAPLLVVWDDAPLYRLQAGPYPSRDEAKQSAERIRETLQLVPMVVERR